MKLRQPFTESPKSTSLLLKASKSPSSPDFSTQYVVITIYLTYKTASPILKTWRSKFLSKSVRLRKKRRPLPPRHTLIELTGRRNPAYHAAGVRTQAAHRHRVRPILKQGNRRRRERRLATELWGIDRNFARNLIMSRTRSAFRLSQGGGDDAR